VLGKGGMDPCLALEGPPHEGGLRDLPVQRRLLAPSLKPGQVVVMDNLSSHKGERVREIIEGKGCQLSHLPTALFARSQPPIEEAFAKLSRVGAQRAGARAPVWR
jgi:hypothetical protein